MKSRIIIAIISVLAVIAAGIVVGTQLNKTPTAGAPGQGGNSPAPPQASPAPPSTPTATGCQVTPTASGGMLTEAPTTRWEPTGPAMMPITQGGPLTTTDGIPQCFTPDSTGALTAVAYSMLFKGLPFTSDQRVRAAETFYEGAAEDTATADARRLTPIVAVRINSFRFLEPIQNNSTALYIQVQHPREEKKVLSYVARLKWTGSTWVGVEPLATDPKGPDKSGAAIAWESPR